MSQQKQRRRPVVPLRLVKTRDAVARACSIATCHSDARPYYDMAQKLVQTWGSEDVAIMLFVGEDWMRGKKSWFPLFVRKTQFAPGYQRYLMMFQPRSRILCDFTIDFCVGGEALYDSEEQETSLHALLADPTLKERLAAGMKNFGMKMPVALFIEVFKEALLEGQKYEPEKLFAQKE